MIVLFHQHGSLGAYIIGSKYVNGEKDNII